MKYVFVIIALGVAGCGPSFVTKKQLRTEIRELRELVKTESAATRGQVSRLQEIYSTFTNKRLDEELKNESDKSKDAVKNATKEELNDAIRKELKKQP